MVIVYGAGGYPKEVRKTPSYEPRTDPTIYVKPTWTGTPMKVPSNDVSSIEDHGASGKFTSPYFWSGRQDGIEGVAPSVPGGAFISEGGLFAEGAGEVIGADEGLYGEAKPFSLSWEIIALLVGIGLLFALGMFM